MLFISLTNNQMYGPNGISLKAKASPSLPNDGNGIFRKDFVRRDEGAAG